ncbi:hypothetical protein ACTHPH_21765 [Paenibacillus pasadenensis]|uniref:hypothetical protein n=1 Tax=Paenibacillus pasadenensis TaxID=217090 RepID=UPI00040B0E8E|nr:hypothetical protein [Paenibacillus pasadenensis]
MMEEKDFTPCQLTEFSGYIGKHYQTINNWFNQLEKEKYHYVNRVTGGKERVFDYEDYKIAYHINQKREQGFNIKPIFEQLKDQEEIYLRPFPESFDVAINDVGQLFEELRHRFTEENRQIMQGLMNDMGQSLLQNLSLTVQTALPSPLDPEQERHEFVTRKQTEIRIKKQLRNEAIVSWEKLPIERRTIKTGFLGKRVENQIAREDFIQNYIGDNEADRWTVEFGLGKTMTRREG